MRFFLPVLIGALAGGCSTETVRVEFQKGSAHPTEESLRALREFGAIVGEEGEVHVEVYSGLGQACLPPRVNLAAERGFSLCELLTRKVGVSRERVVLYLKQAGPEKAGTALLRAY